MENWKKEKAGTNNQLFVNRKGSLGPVEGCCGKFSVSLISGALLFFFQYLQKYHLIFTSCHVLKDVFWYEVLIF